MLASWKCVEPAADQRNGTGGSTTGGAAPRCCCATGRTGRSSEAPTHLLRQRCPVCPPRWLLHPAVPEVAGGREAAGHVERALEAPASARPPWLNGESTPLPRGSSVSLGERGKPGARPGRAGGLPRSWQMTRTCSGRSRGLRSTAARNRTLIDSLAGPVDGAKAE